MAKRILRLGYLAGMAVKTVTSMATRKTRCGTTKAIWNAVIFAAEKAVGQCAANATPIIQMRSFEAVEQGI